MGSSLCSSNKTTNKPSKILIPSKKNNRFQVLGKSQIYYEIEINKEDDENFIPFLESPSKKRKFNFPLQLENKLMQINYQNIKIDKILRESNSQITLQCKNTENNEYLIIKRQIFINLRDFSDHLLLIQNLAKYDIEGIEKFTKIKIYEEIYDEKIYYILDLFKPKLEIFEFKDDIYEILTSIHELCCILNDLHTAKIYCNNLRPSSLLKNNENIIISIGDSKFSSKIENEFYNFFIRKKKHHFSYDVLLIAYLMCYVFDKSIKYEELFSLRNEDERDLLFKDKFQNIPTSIIHIIKRIINFNDNYNIPSIYQIQNEIESLLQKGVQTHFVKLFENNQKINNPLKTNFFYLFSKNKIIIYKDDRIIIIKIFLGLRKWHLPKNSNIIYCEKLQHFFCFSSNYKPNIVRIPFNLNKLQELSQNKLNIIEEQVDFFFNLKKQNFEDSYFLLEDIENNIYVMPKNLDKNNEYLLLKSDQEKDNKITKFPIDLEIKEISYWYLNKRDNNIYGIVKSQNIFQTGIKICVKDLNKTDKFIVKNITFKVMNTKMQHSFIELALKIENIFFIFEVRINLYIMIINKVPIMIDLNQNCFYSFCSLYQLTKYEMNNKENPINYLFPFEIRDLSFSLEIFFNQTNLFIFEKENSIFLQILCKKDNELVLCKFEIIVDQACFLLINCINVLSGFDYCEKKLKNLQISWNMVNSKEIKLMSSILPLKIINNYEIIEKISEYENGIVYRARYLNEYFSLVQCKLNSLQEYEKIYLNFFITLKNSYLFDVYQCFLHYEDNIYYAIIISENSRLTLYDEFEIKKKTKSNYHAKEISFIMKCLFKGILFLHSKNIFDGNINLNNIMINDKGFIKIKGWYFENKPDFVSDFLDAGLILFQLIKMQPIQKIDLNILNENKIFLDENYPGIYSFLSYILIMNYSCINIDEFKKLLLKTFYILQYHNINFKKLATTNNLFFNVNYGDNTIICSDVKTNMTYTLTINITNNDPYYFSTYNSFAYDNIYSIYITGKNRDPLVNFQDFYSASLQFGFKDDIILQKLSPIPANILSPSILYIEDLYELFIFGGYIVENSTKKISNLVFSYRRDEDKWKIRKKLPFSLVSATAVYMKSSIFLFGGFSDEIDLSGPEFCFIEYNLKNDNWALKVNFSLKSPFPNSKWQHPCVIPISNNMFIFFHDSIFKSTLQIIELQMGGIDLKFEKNKENIKIEKLFYKEIEMNKVFHNNLSMCFKNGVFYNLDHKKNIMFTWELNSFDQTKIIEKNYEVISKKHLEFLEYQKKILETD